MGSEMCIRDSRIGGAIGDIGAVAARHHLHLAAAGGVFTKRLDRFGLAAPAALAIGGFGQQRDRCVHTGVEHIARALQLGVFAIVPQVGAVTPDRGFDVLSGLGMLADDARQAEQLQGPFEIEIVEVLGNARALGFLALAQLDVGAEAPRLCLLYTSPSPRDS